MAGRGQRQRRSLGVAKQSNVSSREEVAGMTSTNTGSSPAPAEERSAANIPAIQEGNGTESEVVNGGTQSGSRRKRRSVVWNDFEEVIVDGKLKAECVFCHKKLSGEQSHGTSHLRSHLETCDAKKSIDSKQQKLRLTKGDAGKVNLENYVFDQNVARKELAIMICVHEYPLSMVDHAGFRSFCASLQPMFKMVSRNTIKKDIIGLHETQKNAMIQYFAKFNHRVAVTSDLWTAGHQKKGYMVVTAHFIDEEWELKSFLLRFMYVPCPHNAEVICEALHQVLVEWHLERKISTVTLDNCAANDKAIWNMEDKLDSDSLMLQDLFMDTKMQPIKLMR